MRSSGGGWRVAFRNRGERTRHACCQALQPPCRTCAPSARARMPPADASGLLTLPCTPAARASIPPPEATDSPRMRAAAQAGRSKGTSSGSMATSIGGSLLMGSVSGIGHGEALQVRAGRRAGRQGPREATRRPADLSWWCRQAHASACKRAHAQRMCIALTACATKATGVPVPAPSVDARLVSHLALLAAAPLPPPTHARSRPRATPCRK